MAQANIKAVITAEDRASAALKNFGNNASTMGSKIKKGLKIAAVATAAAGAAAIAFGVSSVKSFQESEKATAQLNAVLKSTKGAAGISAKAATNLADKLSLLNAVDDEAILGAENMLLTFTNIGKNIFPETTQAVIDMSTAMNGGAIPSAEQLRNTTIQLGKALQSPDAGLGALKRVGINVDELRKKFTESMTVQEKQKLILKELATEFGGSGAAAADTYAGKMNAIKIAFENVQESIGKVILDGLSPLIAKLSEFVSSDQFQAWLKTTTEKAVKFVEGINWEKLAADVTAIANAFLAMARVVGGTISNINTWLNRFIALGGKVLFEWQRIINNIKIAWGNLKANIIATGQGIYANIYKYLIDPIIRVGAWIQRTIAKFLNMHPAVAKALAGIGNAIMAPFRPAFNWIINSVARVQAAISGLSAGNISSVAKTVAGAAAKASKKATGTDFFSPRKYAGGTSGAYGGMALVGERGPEMVTLPRGSKVSRADETSRMMGGSTTINITVPMMTGSANERRKVARMLIKDIQDIAQMNGKSVASMMSSNYGLVT